MQTEEKCKIVTQGESSAHVHTHAGMLLKNTHPGHMYIHSTCSCLHPFSFTKRGTVREAELRLSQISMKEHAIMHLLCAAENVRLSDAFIVKMH